MFHDPVWDGVPPLAVVDVQDKLALEGDLQSLLRVDSGTLSEARQCLCLHVALAFTRDVQNFPQPAAELRKELWEASSRAFQHLGDAGVYISSAEAFVRHNAHDCIYADREKDFRVLQLFAPGYMHGKLLGVLRLSHRGTVEVDLVRGQGPVTHTGAIVIRRGHMRAVLGGTADVHHLLKVAEEGARVVRELDATGWGAYLEAHDADAEGDIVPSKPHPCYRCRRPQTPHKARQALDDVGDPARPAPEPVAAPHRRLPWHLGLANGALVTGSPVGVALACRGSAAVAGLASGPCGGSAHGYVVWC